MYIVPCNFKVLRLYLILISGTEAKECFYLKMKNANASILVMNSLPMRLRGCHKVITEPYLCGFPYHKEEELVKYYI
ncbi:hypothetical protein T4D_4136 [Trichinella pseudospiralis]|uniref:Uncharacterized protein n=1 Tax=Trichinella pseudospiralis TaxID=6337 RepID=A0A0V1FT45_TRIPS|nr:hypothetical protein T4D_4136 [Trichinella pseudospiralis]